MEIVQFMYEHWFLTLIFLWVIFNGKLLKIKIGRKTE